MLVEQYNNQFSKGKVTKISDEDLREIRKRDLDDIFVLQLPKYLDLSDSSNRKALFLILETNLE